MSASLELKVECSEAVEHHTVAIDHEIGYCLADGSHSLLHSALRNVGRVADVPIGIVFKFLCF